jgi:hypothetical protein
LCTAMLFDPAKSTAFPMLQEDAVLHKHVAQNVKFI